MSFVSFYHRRRPFEKRLRPAARPRPELPRSGGRGPAPPCTKPRRRQLNAFVKETGGRSDSARISAAGFGRSQAGRASALARAQESLYNERKREALDVIRSGDTPKTLNIGNQRKHIREEGRDLGNRSFLYGTLEDAQKLVDQYSGTGAPKLDGKGNWTHKEFVTADHLIGESVNPKTGIATTTHRFAIHYGKRGTHVVPMEEIKK